MLAAIFGTIALTIMRLILVIGLTIGGAYALTTYVALPGFVDTLIWIGAGGYTLLCILSGIVVAGALAAAAKRTR